jgi:hypothetical protein
VRLVSAGQGHQIASVATGDDESIQSAQDCSHLVHEIYATAGYEYPYASSFDLYAGNANFRRVRHPQAGDLIAWRGHVGIVLDPKQHSFYSLVRSGLQAQNYQAPYWRSRGTPRFYRYVVAAGPEVQTASLALPAKTSRAASHRNASANPDLSAPSEKVSPNPVEEVSQRSKVLASPEEQPSAISAESFPSRIRITSEQRRPTVEETLNAISELSNSAANVFRAAEPLSAKTPIVIFDELLVERIETKHDKGWAHLRIDSHVLIAEQGADFKQRHEKVRWELRRDASGWTAIPPAERTYVTRDAAVRVLSAKLAEMAQSEAAAQHDEMVLGQEARIANLLSALLEK